MTHETICPSVLPTIKCGIESVGVVKEGADPDGRVVSVDVQQFDFRDFNNRRCLDHLLGGTGRQNQRT